jgi:glycosidase
VRSRLAQYGNDLLSLGVDGLRLDAAKHMNPADIADILSGLTSKPYVTQEVIWGAGVCCFLYYSDSVAENAVQEAVQPSMYIGNGAVQEFRYPTLFKQAFLADGADVSNLQNLDQLGWGKHPALCLGIIDVSAHRSC